jgi:hypothetical protein
MRRRIRRSLWRTDAINALLLKKYALYEPDAIKTELQLNCREWLSGSFVDVDIGRGTVGVISILNRTLLLARKFGLGVEEIQRVVS